MIQSSASTGKDVISHVGQQPQQINYAKIIKHFTNPIYRAHQDQLARMLEKLTKALQEQHLSNNKNNTKNNKNSCNAIEDPEELEQLRKLIGAIGESFEGVSSEEGGKGAPIFPKYFLLPFWVNLLRRVMIPGTIDEVQRVEQLSQLEWVFEVQDKLVPVLLDPELMGSSSSSNYAVIDSQWESLLLTISELWEASIFMLERIVNSQLQEISLSQKQEGLTQVSQFYSRLFTKEACATWLRAIDNYIGKIAIKLTKDGHTWPKKSFFIFDLIEALFQNPNTIGQVISNEAIRYLLGWQDILEGKLDASSSSSSNGEGGEKKGTNRISFLPQKLQNIFWCAVEVATQQQAIESSSGSKGVKQLQSTVSFDASLVQLTIVMTLGEEGVLERLRDRLKDGIQAGERSLAVLDTLSLLTFLITKDNAAISKLVKVGLSQVIIDTCLGHLDACSTWDPNIRHRKAPALQPLENSDSEDNSSTEKRTNNSQDVCFRIGNLLLGLLCELVQNEISDPELDKPRIVDGVLIFLHQDSDPVHSRYASLIEKSLVVLESSLDVFTNIHVLRLTDFTKRLLEMLFTISCEDYVNNEPGTSPPKGKHTYTRRKSVMCMNMEEGNNGSISNLKELVSDHPHDQQQHFTPAMFLNRNSFEFPFHSRQSYDQFAKTLLSFIDDSMMLVTCLAGSEKQSEIKNTIVDNEADYSMFRIAILCLQQSIYLNPAVLVKALFTISSICQVDATKKDDLFPAIPDLLKFTRFVGANREEEERLLVATVEAIWNGVVGHFNNEMFFFERDGINRLLNCLKRPSFYVKRHVIGCLLDLLKNEKAILYVWEWRYPDNIKKDILDLLCELWCTEEKRQQQRHLKALKNASTTVNNNAFTEEQIENTKIAATGDAKINQVINSTVTEIRRATIFPESKEKVLDGMIDDLCFKIYAFVCKLGVKQLSSKCVNNPQQKEILCRMVKFFDFKLAQAWLECEEELQIEGIRPVTPDQSCIKEAKYFLKEKALELHDLIEDLRISEFETMTNAERFHYQSIMRRNT